MSLAEADDAATPSFFLRRGDGFVPAEAARSPWNPSHQNGVAIAGLVTHFAEQIRPPIPMISARLDIDIMRPTPFAPITGEARVVRDGRNMQIAESVLLAEGEVTARARLLRVRTADCPSFPEPLPYPAPEATPEVAWVKPQMAMSELVETRTIFGAFDQTGTAAIWARFRCDIVPGTPVSGLVQVAMLADFGNGLSNPVPRTDWSYANVDICVHLVREPVGSWIMLTSETMMQGCGVGLVNTVIGDEKGGLGRAHQTLFIAPARGR